ncbi:putative calpain-like cysteine peptidase [Trypanosoma vivax]|nr:putative calpain-like cysteine peptidase [Trypanosoma vivax]
MIDEFDESTVGPRSSSSKYLYGCPCYEGTVTPCFDDGRLFLIVEPNNNNRWSFYNDTLNSQMHVEVTFGPKSNIKVLENATQEKLRDGSIKCSLIIYPLETELFIEGVCADYKSNIVARGLSDEYLKDMVLQNADQIKKDTYNVFKLVGDKATLDETLSACIKSDTKFVDFTFPPEQESLQIGTLSRIKMIPWERPSMYLSDENTKHVRLFRNGIHPSYVNEGDLGDTWFAGAVACVAEMPDKVRDMFRHPRSLEEGKKERAIGGYRVTFNKNGWWTNVIVDDFIPCAGGCPKFVHTCEDPMELWTPLVQKAYAKIHGGYGFVMSGDPIHAIQDMTGYPCSSFNTAFESAKGSGGLELFEHLLRYCESHFQCVLVTPTRDSIQQQGMSVENFEQTGLLPGRVYAVLRAVFFPATGLRLLQLRNPWGRKARHKWSGNWKTDDAKWEQHLDVASACGYSKEAEDQLYLEWSEVLSHFSGCGVVFVQNPVYDYRVRGSFLQCIPNTCLGITVAFPVILCLSLSQEDRRGTDKAEYPPIMLSVAHSFGDPAVMVVDLNSGFDADHPNPEYSFFEARDTSMFYEFVPENSPYLVVPRAMSSYKELPYVLSIHSPVELGKPHSPVGISFCALQPENRVFANFRKFLAQTSPAQVEFQVRSPDMFFPDIYFGSVLQVDDE